MNGEEYKRIRDEAEKYAKTIVKDVPENFTMLHLECFKVVIDAEIDNALSEIKSRVNLSQLHLLQ